MGAGPISRVPSWFCCQSDTRPILICCKKTSARRPHLFFTAKDNGVSGMTRQRPKENDLNWSSSAAQNSMRPIEYIWLIISLSTQRSSPHHIRPYNFLGRTFFKASAKSVYSGHLAAAAPAFCENSWSSDYEESHWCPLRQEDFFITGNG